MSVIGIGAGIAGLIWGSSTDYVGLLAVLALVGAGQALSFELAEVEGSLSVSVVGSLAGAALFDYRAALPLAVTIAVVDWSARRNSLHTVVYNIGTMALSSIAAASVFTIWAGTGNAGRLVVAAIGILGGAVYFLVNMGLLSFASGVEGHESPWAVFHERFAWLLPHYLVYGFIGAVMAIGYDAVGLYGLAVFAVPLLLDAQDAGGVPQAHAEVGAEAARGCGDDPVAERVARAGEQAAPRTLDRGDGVALGHGRRARLVHRRSLAARAAALARDRPRARALAGGARPARPRGALPRHRQARDPGRDPPEAGEPDRARSGRSCSAMRRRVRASSTASASCRTRCRRSAITTSASTGRAIRTDRGEEIPLGARIIHVADALDSMLTTRIYRAARPVNEALAEVKAKSGTQFCPRCVAALERILPLDSVVARSPVGRSAACRARQLVRASLLVHLRFS